MSYYPMDKQEVIWKYHTFLRAYGLTSSDVSVGAGSALLLHGLRELTNDIDAEVLPHVFDRFSKFLPSSKIREDLCVIQCEMFSLDLHLKNKLPEFVMIEGVRVATLKECLDLKTRMNRIKDQDDIKNIILEMRRINEANDVAKIDSVNVSELLPEHTGRSITEIRTKELGFN